MVFKTKKDSLSNIERYKATFIAKGFTQKKESSTKKILSHVCKKDFLCLSMTLVAHFDLELHKIVVKTTFLNGDLEDEVYIKKTWRFMMVRVLLASIRNLYMV